MGAAAGGDGVRAQGWGVRTPGDNQSKQRRPGS